MKRRKKSSQSSSTIDDTIYGISIGFGLCEEKSDCKQQIEILKNVCLEALKKLDNDFSEEKIFKIAKEIDVGIFYLIYDFYERITMHNKKLKN